MSGSGMWKQLGVVFAMALACGGCDGILSTNKCTLIGCGDHTLVVVRGEVPASGLTVRVVDQATGVARQVACAGPAQCAAGLTIDDFIPDEAVIELVVDGEVVHTATQAGVRTTVRPNGPDCDPACVEVRYTVDY